MEYTLPEGVRDITISLDGAVSAVKRASEGRESPLPIHEYERQYVQDTTLPPTGAVLDAAGQSWRVLQVHIGIPSSRPSSKEDAISTLQHVNAAVGHSPTREEVDAFGETPSSLFIECLFGSWVEAKKAADISLNDEDELSYGPQHENLISVKRFADRGGIPRPHEIEKYSEWSSAALLSQYPVQTGLSITNKPQWYGAEVGWLGVYSPMSYHAYRPRVTRGQAISSLYTVAHELGKSPSASDIQGASVTPNIGPITDLFGGWAAAKQYAGLYTNRAEIRPEIRYYGADWTDTRSRVIARDEGTCRLCAEDVHLHVHHIIPYFDVDELSDPNIDRNLVTLCPSCHAQTEQLSVKKQCTLFRVKKRELPKQVAQQDVLY